jgi:hypothetical protein
MEATRGQAGIKSSTGKITLPAAFTGVALRDLAELVGGLDPALGVNVVAKDGYGLTFSYDQMVNGTFVAYDPATGDEIRAPEGLTAIVAYEREGQGMSEVSDGTLRVAIVSDRNNQVTDGHWSIKWVTKLEVKSLAADWVLTLHGALNEKIDRASFESCVQCHKATWTDDKAQVWTGIPLWLLLGYVDDDAKHQDDAFNDAVSAVNYSITLRASDGYEATLDSRLAGRNDGILAVAMVNDNPLPDKYFPVRIVGDGLAGNQQIGALQEIILHLEDGPASLPAQPGTAVFYLVRSVDAAGWPSPTYKRVGVVAYGLQPGSVQ